MDITQMKFNKELQGRAGRNLAHEKYAVLWDFVFGSYSQYNNKEQVRPTVMLWSHKLKKYWMEEVIYNMMYQVVEKQ